MYLSESKVNHNERGKNIKIKCVYLIINRIIYKKIKFKIYNK